ncbi:hypothetical protein Vadar_020451 [Vaccinium darrowii]|uniref:Uncharacterized protein n=1 Tax=Vaccinium darrowii TaxID=229202 RepID=A0ACB7XT82_9ERIC|nr:hypothetical protein Vadar_020451 [Vaccinium darrowii]
MSNPLIVVDKIVEYFVGKVCQSVGRHVCFLFHYKRNVKNLDDEKNDIQQLRSNVQEKVVQAEHRGEAIDNDVSKWLQDADKASQEVDTFMAGKGGEENMMCFNFSCPNFISRYRLSKQAEKKAISIKQLTEKGSQIGTVSHPREDPPELELPSSRDYEAFHSRQKVFNDIVEALKDSNVNMIGVYGTGGVEEAWNLFKKKVGNHVDPHDQSLRDIAWAVCKECKGLPVAIDAVGAALKDTSDMHAWNDAFHKLKNSKIKEIEGIDPEVYVSLKWSYDKLKSEDAKSCFLLCCLFAEDAEISIDDLVRHYMAGRTLGRSQILDTLKEALDRVSTVVQTLKNCCLLLDGRHKHVVKMHDVVRDVAISIAEDEKSFLVKHSVRYWPEKDSYKHCSVISLMPHEMGEFPNELVCPKLHTLRLDCTVNNKLPLHVPNMFFSGAKNLLALDLIGVPLLPALPISLSKLAKLKMLCLNQCKLGNIAILKNLKDHLELLSLRDSDIKELPPEVGELTRLRLLDMRNCQLLEMIPRGVMSKLVLLEELYMPMTFNRWEGTSVEREISNVSLDELMSLTHLTTLHIWIEDPALLPNRFSFENLARFIIIVGATSPVLGSEGTLGLENIHVENVLEFLLGNPTRKQSTRGNGFYPSTFFNHLGTLRVTNCRLKYLFSPSCARLLVQLESLDISNCSIMEGVIGTEGENDEDIVFRRLKFLHLRHLANLISFYPKKSDTATSSGSSSTHAQMALFNDKAAFPALERLQIYDVPDITEIWNKQILPTLETATESSFSQLSAMTISGCGKLINVVGGCPKIEAIEMEKQKGKVVDDYVTRFPKLTTLELDDLPNLESFCNSSVRCEGQVPLFDHQATFPALERLEICSVPEITEIWNKQILPIPETTTESFCCQLSEMAISHCDKLVNVVGGCPKIEAMEMEKKKGKVVDDYVTRFPKLMTLELSNLPNLESFCNSSVRCEGQVPLFGHQAAFPALERLQIYYVPDITEIWNKQILPTLETATESSFSQLSAMTISGCGKLINVVGGCPKIEAMEMEKQKGKVVDDYVTRFPKLTTLELYNLPNFESFCNNSVRCEGQVHLFDHQAVFLALERLEIYSLPEITEIWNKQIFPIPETATESSFSQLSKMTIVNCDKLMNVVGGCPKIEAIEMEKQKGKVVDDYVTCFPKLTTLELKGLPNLESFCSSSARCEAQVPLFDHQAVFLALERLEIYSLPEITEIWNKQIFPIPETATESSFSQLSKMTIVNCDKLMNVVGGCPKIEAIEMEKQKGKVVDDYVTCFPKLTTLELKGLPNLESFCSSSARCEAQVPLFDHQVAFPALERLDIRTLPNITDIWDKKIRPAHQPFCPLHGLYVEDCGKFVYVVPSNMLPQLRNLKSLYVSSCPMVEVIVDLEKKEEGTQEAANNTIVPFPQLSFMLLKRLQKLRGFCAFRSEEHRVVNTQVAFPKLKELIVDTFREIVLRQLTDASELSLKRLVLDKCDEVSTVVSPHLLRRLRFVDLLYVRSYRGARDVFHFDGLEVGEGQVCVGQLTQVRKLYLEGMPQLTCLWNKDPHRLLGLQSLEYLTIKNCPLLANLFTASVAKALGGLKVIYLISCSTMEAIIATDEGHTDVLDDDREIVFPKLEWLILKGLSNLKSFCTSNHNFNFPSLKRVVLKRCPKVQTFTSGSIRMPQILLSTRANVCLTIEDLNKHLKGDQETTAENEMFGDEERFSDPYSLWEI